MKIPQKPPTVEEQLEALRPVDVRELWIAGRGPRDESYLHWDELRRRKPPNGLPLLVWWALLRLPRSVMLKPIALPDSDGAPHWIGMPDIVHQHLVQVDRQAGGRIAAAGDVSLEANRDRYVYSSLMEEAISSSLIEGAATTRRVAKDMLRAGRAPRTNGERMVLKNFRGMEYVRANRSEAITPERIFELHRILTLDTLEDATSAGRFRRTDEPITVQDMYGEVLHTPPPAEQLSARMEALCAFAAGESPDFFIHPAVRAILLHYWLAYDHPFVDGNGRTARALFYWSMLAHGYWMMEFVAISRVIHAAPAKYGRSFLFTQTDGNDTTYFVIQQLEFLVQALEELESYLVRKVGESRRVERSLHGSREFNPRQIALLSHALRHPEAEYTVQSHRGSHGIVYETARVDLLGLVKHGLLEQGKRGRAMVFRPAPELERKLERGAPGA